MKEKILTFLKTKLSGVQEIYLSGIAESYAKTITKEEEIETTFTDHVLELIKLSWSQMQVEGDRRATEAQKNALKNFQEKHGLDENGKPVKKTTDEPPKKKTDKGDETDVPEWFRVYQASVEQQQKELKNKLESMEREKTHTLLMGKVKSKLKEKSVPEWFSDAILGNLVIESEDKLDQLVSKLEGDYATSKQKMVEEGVVISIPPGSKGGTEKGEVEGKNIAEKRNAMASDGVKGKKV